MVQTGNMPASREIHNTQQEVQGGGGSGKLTPEIQNSKEGILAQKLLDSTQEILASIQDPNISLKERMELIQRPEIQQIMDLFRHTKTNEAMKELSHALGTRIDELYAGLSETQSLRNMEIGRETIVATAKNEEREQQKVRQELEVFDHLMDSPYIELDLAFA